LPAQKIKKGAGNLTLELVKTPDIISGVNGKFLKIGFAAETQDLVANAKKETDRKSIGHDYRQRRDGKRQRLRRRQRTKLFIISKNGKQEDLPLMTKREVADKSG